MDFLFLGALVVGLLVVFRVFDNRTWDNQAYKFTVGLLLVAAFFWPWIDVIAGSGHVPDLATMASVGMLGVLLLATIIAYKETKSYNLVYRSAVGVALGATFLLNWMIPAVGVLGRDGHPADLMYLGVLAVGIIGALVSRFTPQGMARALLATALAHGLVAGIGVIAGMVSLFELLGINGFFVALWLGSAWLFQIAAARERPSAGA